MLASLSLPQQALLLGCLVLWSVLQEQLEDVLSSVLVNCLGEPVQSRWDLRNTHLSFATGGAKQVNPAQKGLESSMGCWLPLLNAM